MQPQELFSGAASALAAYYGLLDADQRMLLNALAYTAFLALSADLTMKAVGHARRIEEEDPIQVVLTQPVRVGHAKYAKGEIPRRRQTGSAVVRQKAGKKANETPATSAAAAAPKAGKFAATPPGWRPRIKMPAVKLRPPKLNLRMPSPNIRLPKLKMRLPKLKLTLPKTDRGWAARKRQTEAPPPEKKMQKTNPQPIESVSSAGPEPAMKPARCGCAVAEIDFIRAATDTDLAALKSAFGYVYVHSDTYMAALSASHSKGVDGRLIFIPADVRCGDMVYPSIAVAAKTCGMVLSDSQNVRRICGRQGIPCMSSHDWRAQEAR